MALSAPTLLTGIGAAASTVTSASVTPAGNATLYAVCNAFLSSGNPAQPTITDSVGLVWTEITDILFATGSNPRIRQRVWWADVNDATPSAMTITVAHAGGSQTHLQVAQQVGAASRDYSNTSYGQDLTAGDPSLTLPSVPDATSTVIAFMTSAGGNAFTGPTGFTNLQDSALSTARRSCVRYDAASASQNLAVTSTNLASQMVAFEVKEAPAGVSAIATAGHVLIHGYVGFAGASDHKDAIATAGHALIHGYVGNVSISDNKQAIAVSGHALVHGYQGFVRASDNKVVIAANGHTLIHGYVGSVGITSNKRVEAVSGHALIHGYVGTVTAPDHKSAIATGGHVLVHGYVGYVNVHNPGAVDYFPGQNSDTAQRYAHDSGTPNGFEVTNLYMGYDGTYFYKNWPGFRFPGIAMSQGSVINSATLSLQVDVNEQGAGPFGTLFGYDADNPATFDATNNPTAAPHTAASVSITTANRALVDVTAIVQELVDRVGWASGNAVAFVGDPTPTAGSYTSWVPYINGGVHTLSIVASAPAAPVYVEAVAGHVLIHGYVGNVAVTQNVVAFATSGHIKVHGYLGNVFLGNDQSAIAIAGSVKVHGYPGFVAVTQNKLAFATSGHMLIHGYPGAVTVSDNKAVQASSGSAKVIGFIGYVSATDSKVVAAQSGHIAIIGSVGTVTVATPGVYRATAGLIRIIGVSCRVAVSTSAPPPERTHIIDKENRTFTVTKENRLYSISLNARTRAA